MQVEQHLKHRYSQCYINNPAPAQPTISTMGKRFGNLLATTYQWYLNGDLIVGATSQNYTPTQSGIYVVKLQMQMDVFIDILQGYVYSISTGIHENETKNISIYPNPTTGIL